MIRKLIGRVVKSRLTYMAAAAAIGMVGLDKYREEIMALVRAVVGQ